MGKIYIGDTLISITPGSTEAEAAYTKAQSDQKITDLIDGAPDTLNTLNEIAEGIGNLKLDSLADVEIKDGKVGTIDTISGGTQAVDGEYTGVGSASSGSGTGATFNVVVASGSVGSITVNNAGSGYIIDETLSITEESLGYNGSSGTGSDPVTFDVATLADAGIMIYDATAAGTKADPHFINKTLSEIGIVTSASPVFTGDFTVDENANGTTFFVDSTNDRVGIGTKVPGAKLVVIGDTKLNGDLSVDTNELFVDSTNSRVGIGTATPTAGHNLTVAGSSLFNHNILLPGVSKGFTKQNCYYKTGGIRLQKAASANDEVTLRYNGATSNDFIIQQQYNNAAAGKITLVGTLPSGNANVGETAIRLDAQVIDVGFTNVNLINLKGDTEVGSNKSVIFKDSRDATDGLQFFHTGVRAAAGEAGRDAIQMGMYGNSGDADYGKFKITHKVGSATNTDVLSVSNGGGNITIHKPTQFTNGISGTLSTAAQGNITSVGNLTSATVSGDLSVDTDTLKVDATNDRVGINKAVPTVALDVNGNAIAAEPTASTHLATKNYVDGGEFNFNVYQQNSGNSTAAVVDIGNQHIPSVDIEYAYIGAYTGILPAQLFKNKTYYDFYLRLNRGVTGFGDQCFFGGSTQETHITPQITTLGNEVYKDNVYLSGTVDIPNTITQMGTGVFSGANISSYTIGTGISTIPDSTFKDCYSLTAVNFPSHITSIGASAFSGAAGALSSPILTIPDNIITIGDNAFDSFGGSSLTTLTIGDGVTTIGDDVFSNSGNNLSSLTLGSSVTTIGVNAFRDMYSITSFTIPNSVTSIDTGAFQAAYSMGNVTFESGGTSLSIGTSAFSDHYDATIIDLPAHVSALGNNAFGGAGNSFSGGTPLIVRLRATSPPAITGAPFSSSNASDIEVPTSALSAYGGVGGTFAGLNVVDGGF